jgi:hypothetical protein
MSAISKATCATARNNKGTDYPLAAGGYFDCAKALLAFEVAADTIMQMVIL